MSKQRERVITVCNKCLCATCWYGIFLCDEALNAGITTRTESELYQLGREHPSYWTPKAVAKYTGVKEEVEK